ncbi:STAS domain-containing protein [Conexibacter sp. CPCC 206217]|uniref:STAS domain-containing protein n=1 Tax=Conexibacter sp. CPCC 206217 TaxID=3064574 RepID=UPI00271BF021|nr:STAS domain-containing protein [Conexibacter sp. CPCC 206217]MDO8213105.1 STAS domain-containing protein [Conexibacter sp. CPCC 206217]
MSASPHLEIPAGFEISIELGNESVVVAPIGDLDARAAHALEQELEGLVARGFTDIVLDLRGALFVGSSGSELLDRLEANKYTDGYTLNIRAGGGASAGPARRRRRFQRAPSARSL